MAQTRIRLLLISALAGLLPMVSRASSVEQAVKPSNNRDDILSPYRYIMNVSQLMMETDTINLAPLTRNLWDFSPQDFKRRYWHGQLHNLSEHSPGETTGFVFPYISCDDDGALGKMSSAFNATNGQNVPLAILYSRNGDHCVISDQLVSSKWLNVLTVIGMGQVQTVPEFDHNSKSSATVQIFADSDSSPSRSGSDNSSGRSNSPIPMIVLYSLTSLITTLLLFVIVGGAIKARRHPERYGPRAVLRPRQSRAKGIAMAILETLPIVKFGDPDPDPKQSQSGEEHVEMTEAGKGPAVAIQGEGLKSSSGDEAAHRSPILLTDDSTPRAQQDTDIAAPGVNRGKTTSNSQDAADTTSEAALPKHADNSLSCSICTEDFTFGESVRVLPCNHKFHPLCVDPWLLNISGTCPLCRIDLRPPQEASAEGEGLTSLASGRGFLSFPARPRSTAGSGMYGIRAADLQGMNAATQEERIALLRNWRDQMRPRGSVRRNRADESTAARHRSARLSQWMRDGFAVRPSPEQSPPHTPAATVSSSRAARPRTWFGHHEGVAATSEQARRSSTDGNCPLEHEERTEPQHNDTSAVSALDPPQPIRSNPDP